MGLEQFPPLRIIFADSVFSLFLQGNPFANARNVYNSASDVRAYIAELKSAGIMASTAPDNSAPAALKGEYYLESESRRHF